MYQLEDVQNEAAVQELFAKHFPEGMQKLGASLFFPFADAPDFCKVLGFSSQQGATQLEQIANFISQEGYEEKVDKFTKKCDKMKHKLMEAKKAAKPSATTTAAGGLAGLTSVTSIGDIVAQAEKMKQEECSDAKVSKAQCKLDKYIEKNKTLHESTKYTTAGKAVGGLIGWGAGMEGNEKNINEEIAAEKKSAAAFSEAATGSLKAFLDELLKVAGKVGIMAVMDGNKTSTTHTMHNLTLDQLTSSRLMNAQNREMFYITK